MKNKMRNKMRNKMINKMRKKVNKNRMEKESKLNHNKKRNRWKRLNKK